MAERSLIVTSCEQVYTGTGKSGKQFTIYTVSATAEDGSPVGLPLRSFDDLSPNIGKPVDYEVTPYTRNDETTYTLKGPRVPLTPRVRELEERVAALEGKIGYLARGEKPPQEPSDPSAPAVPADEDIPFLWRPAEFEDRYEHGSRW